MITKLGERLSFISKKANAIEGTPDTMVGEAINMAGPGFGLLGGYMGGKLLYDAVRDGGLTGRRTMYSMNVPGSAGSQSNLFSNRRAAEDFWKKQTESGASTGTPSFKKVNAPLWRRGGKGSNADVIMNAEQVQVPGRFADRYTKGSRKYVKNSTKEFLTYVRRNPQAFMRALGKGSLGAALMAGSAAAISRARGSGEQEE